MIARSLITIGYWVGLHLHFERIGGYITSALTRCLSVDWKIVSPWSDKQFSFDEWNLMAKIVL